MGNTTQVRTLQELLLKKRVAKTRFTKAVNNAYKLLSEGSTLPQYTLKNIREIYKEIVLILREVQERVAHDAQELDKYLEQEAQLKEKYEEAKAALNGIDEMESVSTTTTSRSMLKKHVVPQTTRQDAHQSQYWTSDEEDQVPIKQAVTKASVHEPPRSVKQETTEVRPNSPVKATTQAPVATANQHPQQVPRNWLADLDAINPYEPVQRQSFHPPQAYPYMPYAYAPVPRTAVKLEPLKLKEFDGSHTEWETFRDTFEALVHDNPHISPIEKFQRLEALVRNGRARSFLQQVKVTSTNYDSVWKDMKTFYNNERRIVDGHIHDILQLKPVRDGNVAELRLTFNNFKGHLRGLKSIGHDTNVEAFQTQILLSKLDDETRKKWEGKMASETKVQPLSKLFDLVEKRIRILEATTGDKKSKREKDSSKKSFLTTASKDAKKSYPCPECGEGHPLYKCSKFLEKTPEERLVTVKGKSLCFNCFYPNHSSDACQKMHCRSENCSLKHNTLLHGAWPRKPTAPPTPDCNPVVANTVAANPEPVAANPQSVVANTIAAFTRSMKEIILSTVCFHALDKQGKPHNVRALIDCCSQEHFVSARLQRKLALPTRILNSTFVGVGKGETTSKSRSSIHIKSCYSDYNKTMDFVVIEDITEQLPSQYFDVRDWNIPKDIKLADPSFNHPGRIDMLLSAEVFFEVLQQQKICLGPDKPYLILTSFGWVVGGAYSDPNVVSSIARKPVGCTTVTLNSLQNMLERFWTIEQFDSERKPRTEQDEFVEQHFVQNYEIQDGRFVVQLPFTVNPEKLGESRKKAEWHWHSMERKFVKNPQLKTLYDDFMNKYLELNHMAEVSPMDEMKYFIPHHFVYKPGKEKKFRVVFNASSKTTSNVSLNECLPPGPHIQDELIVIILRFRTHTVALTGDIEKMYRQVLVNPKHQLYQGIIYRKDPTTPLKVYKLLTLTYGTAPAAFLATRCIQEAVNLDGDKFPLAKRAASQDFYVDDVLSGADTVESAIMLRNQLQELMAAYGFPLCKWSSNNEEVLNTIPTHLKNPDQQQLKIDEDDSIKTLGLSWSPSTDSFSFQITQFSTEITKRNALSDTAKLFDPLGFVSPLVIFAKIFMQTLWAAKIEWDTPLSGKLLEKWTWICENMKKVVDFKVPRPIVVDKQNSKFHLFGYSDASTKAYGMCVYLVSQHADGHASGRLIMSKSKVAPLKTQSIPRLELCSFVMLAEQMRNVEKALQLSIISKKAFSDSQIVLKWCAKEASNWKCYVANRVAKIRELIDPDTMYHVPSQENPADLISRGCDATALKDNSLWWCGGSRFTELLANSRSCKQLQLSDEDLKDIEAEKKAVILVSLKHVSPVHDDVLNLSNDFNFVVNVFAYVLKFVKCCRDSIKSKTRKEIKQMKIEEIRKAKIYELLKTGGKVKIPLTFMDIQESKLEFARYAQSQSFPEELAYLKEKIALEKSSSLLQYNPYYDHDDRVLRVGGRLSNSEFKFSGKHPIVLPANHCFTRLLFEQEHKNLLHAGPTLLLSHIRRRWFPIRGRQLATSVYRKCVTCFRVDPKLQGQIMGDLPSYRVTRPSKPFQKCSVDYGGPFLILQHEGKRCKTFAKAYFAIFVCLATKAIHLEAVTDATTIKFMSALRRFIATRGKVTDIYADNGTNFRGADNEMREFYKMMNSDETQRAIDKELTPDRIQFHFIPASSPHMNGLCEANVKATKFHMKRIMGQTKLSFEELYTLLKQIEACLNSRPLCRLDNEPGEIRILTSGHFLTLDSLVAIPEPDYLDIPMNRLKRYQLIQRMFQDFWKQYSSLVFADLQVRTKWRLAQQNVKSGDVVLIKDDNLPPLQWKMGRVMQVFPDKDQRVRQVELFSNGHTIRRAIHKICIVPTCDESTTN